MNNIATVLTAGPMTWQQIQAGLERDCGWMHGAVLIGVLNVMIRRGLIVREGSTTVWRNRGSASRSVPGLQSRIQGEVHDGRRTRQEVRRLAEGRFQYRRNNSKFLYLSSNSCSVLCPKLLSRTTA